MAKWGYVENNEIKKTMDYLPNGWKNVCGLYYLENDLNLLQSFGWYPVVEQHQDYDKTTHKSVGFLYSFENDRIIETLNLEELNFQQEKQKFLIMLRDERNRRLASCDWTQTVDYQNVLDNETKNRWLSYRQALRDLPQQYEQNNIIDFFEIIWPEF
jgi:hypothetical protein